MSRQAIEQALARTNEPPIVRQMLGQHRLYEHDELIAWWHRRAELSWKEHRMKAATMPTGQCNIRITSDDTVFMRSIAGPGQTLSAVARMLLIEAIEARRRAGS